MTMLGRLGTWRRAAPIGCAALIVALLAGGCGSSPDDEPAQRSSSAPGATTTSPARTPTTPRSTSGNGKPKASATATTTTPRSAKPGARPASPSRTTTTTAPAPTPAPKKQSRPTPAKVGKPQTFSGDGDRVIETLVLARNAVVRWTVTGGGRFTVRDAGGKLKISGSGASGQSFAASGDYRAVKVTAGGRWTLSFASLGA